MNIVSIIMQFMGPAIVSKLAGSLGINSTIAQKAIGAALPAILAGIMGKASQPGGAGILGDLIGKQDPGLLGNLAGMIGGSQQSQIAQQGSSVLGSLLGGSQLGALTGALGKFTGANDTATTGLLGMLAPIVLGSLGQQQKSMGLDAGGLAKMLMGQKDNISAAMPGDFAKMLGGSGLLDSIGGGGSTLGQAAAAATGAAGAAAGMAGRAASNVGSAASQAGSAASSAAGSAANYGASAARQASGFNWKPWVMGLLGALALWWLYNNFFASVPRLALPQAPKITVGSTDVGAQMSGAFGSLPGILASVKDASSAQAALPKLQDVSGRLDTLNGMLGQFSPEAKKAVAGYAGSSLPALEPMLTGALKAPGALGVLEPIIKQIIARITGFSKL
jgi:Bacterial protein of unknown function (DUF937)